MPSAPRERILNGKAGPIDRADIRSERPREAERLDAIDRQLAPMGLRPVGDLVCARFPDVLGRGYASATGDTWGGLFFGLIETSFDFVTEFENAFLMTTLNGRGEGDDAKKGVYISRFPKLGFDRLVDLLEKHDARKAALSAKLGAPLATRPDLRAFAEAVDRGIARQLGKA